MQYWFGCNIFRTLIRDWGKFCCDLGQGQETRKRYLAFWDHHCDCPSVVGLSCEVVCVRVSECVCELTTIHTVQIWSTTNNYRTTTERHEDMLLLAALLQGLVYLYASVSEMKLTVTVGSLALSQASPSGRHWFSQSQLDHKWSHWATAQW